MKKLIDNHTEECNKGWESRSEPEPCICPIEGVSEQTHPTGVRIVCASLDCPERKSICCGAISMECPHPKEYGGQFDCSACGGWFHGGKCTSSVQDANEQESVGSLSMETQEKMDKKNLINGKEDKQEDRVYSFIEAYENEEVDHESCGYDSGCILHSKTLWDQLDKILSKARAEGSAYKGEVKRIAYQMGSKESRNRVIEEILELIKAYETPKNTEKLWIIDLVKDEMYAAIKEKYKA